MNPSRFIAVLVGIILLWFVFAVTKAHFVPGYSILLDVIKRVAFVGLSAVVIGAIFGYAWPAVSWRWGFWINLPTFLWTIFLAMAFSSNFNQILDRGEVKEAIFFLLWLFGFPTLSFAATCTGAHIGALFRKKKSIN